MTNQIILDSNHLNYNHSMNVDTDPPATNTDAPTAGTPAHHDTPGVTVSAPHSRDSDISTATYYSQDSGCSFSVASSTHGPHGQVNNKSNSIQFYANHPSSSQKLSGLDIEMFASGSGPLSGPHQGKQYSHHHRSGPESESRSGRSSSASASSGSLVRSRTRNVFSYAEMSHAKAQPLTLTKYFGHDVRNYTDGSPNELEVDKELRNFIEPHIAKARTTREEKRQLIFDNVGLDPQTIKSMSISNNAYVPYATLRNERRFLYDVDSYPLHQILADTIGVEDLSLIHHNSIQDKRQLMRPLLDARKRRPFHQCYDNFVTSFCIPLLHSLGMVQRIFNDSSRNMEPGKICYRYQAFPCIRVIRPGEFSIGPHCDMAYGHSMGNINFHIPLTPTFGTNALYTESHPGREDWHALKTKSVGLGFSFDGARCLHFTLENTTNQTRVSLDFRIAICRDKSAYSVPSVGGIVMKLNAPGAGEGTSPHGAEEEEEIDLHDTLCNKKMLKDSYSLSPGYYEEACVDLGANTSNNFNPGPVAHKRNQLSGQLMHPDKRVGFPF